MSDGRAAGVRAHAGKKSVLPAGGGAVVSQRRSPTDALDDFPTPPWGTRALVRHVLEPLLADGFCISDAAVWEPAANRGIMVEVLREFCPTVYGSDVHDYGYGFPVGSFIGEGGFGLDVAACPFDPDWIITNPPFTLGAEFVRRALGVARCGVAMLLRTAWIESAERFELFREHPFMVLAPFSGRLAMVQGRYDPAAKSLTSYSWFVWLQGVRAHQRVIFIPPDAERRLSRPDDAERFACR